MAPAMAIGKRAKNHFNHNSCFAGFSWANKCNKGDKDVVSRDQGTIFERRADWVAIDSRPGLTDGQKACLRLVDDHHTSKEIARILGISPFTVDQRLDAARRKLNAQSRKDAAKIFAAIEHGKLSEPFVYQPLWLEHGPIADILMSPPNRVEQALAKFSSFVSVPPIGGDRHELSKKEILVQSLNIAFFSTLVIAFVVVLLTGTLRLFQ